MLFACKTISRSCAITVFPLACVHGVIIINSIIIQINKDCFLDDLFFLDSNIIRYWAIGIGAK